VSAALVDRALEIALTKVGIRETSRNRGPEIDTWVRRIGLDPEGRHPYCVAFLVGGVFYEAAQEIGLRNPLPATGKAIRLWLRSPSWARAPLVKRGCIFVRVRDLEDPDSAGHAGLVVDVVFPEKRIITVEANTNPAGSREGDGVYKRSRPFEYVNLGYLDFGARET